MKIASCLRLPAISVACRGAWLGGLYGGVHECFVNRILCVLCKALMLSVL